MEKKRTFNEVSAMDGTVTPPKEADCVVVDGFRFRRKAKVSKAGNETVAPEPAPASVPAPELPPIPSRAQTEPMVPKEQPTKNQENQDAASMDNSPVSIPETSPTISNIPDACVLDASSGEHQLPVPSKTPLIANVRSISFKAQEDLSAYSDKLPTSSKAFLLMNLCRNQNAQGDLPSMPPSDSDQARLRKLCENVITSEYDALYRAAMMPALNRNESEELAKILRLAEDVSTRFMLAVEETSWTDAKMAGRIATQDEFGQNKLKHQYEILQSLESKYKQEMEIWSRIQQARETIESSMTAVDVSAMHDAIIESRKKRMPLLVSEAEKKAETIKYWLECLVLANDVISTEFKKKQAELATYQKQHDLVVKVVNERAFEDFQAMNTPHSIIKSLLQ